MKSFIFLTVFCLYSAAYAQSMVVGVLKHAPDQFVCATSKTVMAKDTSTETIYGEKKIITFEKNYSIDSRTAEFTLKTPDDNPVEASFKLIVSREYTGGSDEAYDYYRQQLFLAYPTKYGPEQVSGQSSVVSINTDGPDSYYVYCRAL